MVDIPNRIARNGLIYFPEFCQLVLDNLRQDKQAEEDFKRSMFKVLCGTESFPTDFRAKKYKLDKHCIEKVWLTFLIQVQLFISIQCRKTLSIL